MVAPRPEPPRFAYEKLIPSVGAADAFGRTRAWLLEENARILKEEAPKALAARHGRRRLYWGTEPDAPKTFEFRFEEAGPDTHLRVTASPAAYSSPGVVQEPELARANYARALEPLWAKFPSISPYRAAEGALLLDWQAEERRGRRDVRNGGLALAALAALAVPVVYYVNVVTHTALRGIPGAAVGGLVVALGSYGLHAIIAGRRRARNAMVALGGPAAQRGR